MCGLCFIMRKDDRPAVKQLLKTYERQKSRGVRGFGFVGFTKGKIDIVDRDSEETRICKSLREIESRAIMFHHRNPTSTPNFSEGAHPIYVSNPRLKYDYYVIHNGVITNDKVLKEKHEKLGYKYTTEMFMHEVWHTKDTIYTDETIAETKFNDSEALAIELAEAIENNQSEVGAYGSIAFMCLQTDKYKDEGDIKIENMFYGRNSNPLILEDNNNYFKLSSEGNGKSIEPHTLYKYNLEANVVLEKPCTFGFKYVESKFDSKNFKEEKSDGIWRDGHHFHDIEEYAEYCSEKRSLPIKFEDDRVNEYVNDEYQKKADDRLEQIEAELEEMSSETKSAYEPYLSGDETLEELQAMNRNAVVLIEKYKNLGDLEKAEDYEYFKLEIEDAIITWQYSNKTK